MKLLVGCKSDLTKKLEKVDRRMFEEKKESIRKKMEERKLREEQPEKLDEVIK